MLGFFKNKSKGKVICSPCNGRVVPITEVPDPTFSEKILGDGVAVIPSEGRFYAPADGEVTAVFDTLHAFTMTTTQGVELLLHIGLDTVVLKGAPFTSETAITPIAWMIFLRMHLSRHFFRMQCFAWKVHFTPMAI